MVCLFWLGVLGARLLGRKASFSLAPLGFSRPKGGLLGGVGFGVAVGAGAILMSIVVNPISVFVLDRLGYPTESTVQQPFMRGLTGWVEDNPAAAIPAIILVVVFIGPAVEELVFRGAIFNGLNRLGARLSSRSLGNTPDRPAGRAPFVLSALVSSTFFALLHLEPVLLPAILILAVALCVLFQRTGSLIPPLVAHATFNSFATSLIILNGLGILDIPV
ncbi:MAG TPA: CPBP family intramembrane glutamic endopeptidase [Rubrobacter sp.]|nr:CPBP family intramembrane glutamic endopeptidase [Rubrobacter sp.]